jgi:pimeloyl-ACP methyl ester carboxylesterase
MKTELLLLPGMDGTGQLFGPFVDALPRDVSARILSYPSDRVMTYEALLSWMEEQIEPSIRHVIVAESFSGPLAIEYAHRRSADIAAVILCASFVSNPFPHILQWLPGLACKSLFAISPPSVALRTWMLDFRAPAELVSDVQKAIRQVRPAVLAARIRELASVNVADKLRELRVPVLYLAAAQDRLVGQRGVKQVQAAAPGVDFRVLNGPHLLLQSRPGEAAAAIVAFLQSNGVH